MSGVVLIVRLNTYYLPATSTWALSFEMWLLPTAVPNTFPDHTASLSASLSSPHHCHCHQCHPCLISHVQWTTKYWDSFYIYFLKYPSSLSFLKHFYLTKKLLTYNIYEFVINNRLSGLEYLHWPESIIFLLLQNLQMGKLCQSFVGHEIRAREGTSKLN